MTSERDPSSPSSSASSLPAYIIGKKSWRPDFRAWLGEFLTSKLLEQNSIVQDHYPPSEKDVIKPILFRDRFKPGFEDVSIAISENTPKSENDPPGAAFLNLLLRWKEKLRIDLFYHDPWTDHIVPYPSSFAEHHSRPERPKDFQEGADTIAGIVRRGPFSIYTQKRDNEYILDLRHLETLSPRQPFLPTGGLARVTRISDTDFTTQSIEFQGKIYTPDDADWRLTEKRFLCGLNTHVSVLDHLTNLHLCSAGALAIGTFRCLSSSHPLRIMLHPFCEETFRVNHNIMDGLIGNEHASLPFCTGYSLTTIKELMSTTIQQFDICSLDPEQRFRGQGTLDDKAFPTIESITSLYRIFRKFTAAWCQRHLDTVDAETKAWCEELQRRVPNGGIYKLVNAKSIAQLTLDHVAHIAATLMFAASVWHYVVSYLTRDYFMTLDVMPPACDENGYPTKGIVLEKRNSIEAFSVLRYKLISVTVHLPEPSMEELWTNFQMDLLDYRQDIKEDRQYRIDPQLVPSSIHA